MKPAVMMLAVAAVAPVALLPAPAFAECAWVLWAVNAKVDPDAPWVKSTTYRPSDFSPTRAFETAKACEQRKDELETEELRMKMERNKIGIWDAWIYRCLPDTIDPRGSKSR